MGCPQHPPTSEVFLEEAEAEALAVRSDDLGQRRRAAEEDLHLPLPLLGHLAKHLERGEKEKGKGSGSLRATFGARHEAAAPCQPSPCSSRGGRAASWRAAP